MFVPGKRDMPPKSCPLHLQRLIDRENALPASDPHPLRQILKAFRARRQNKGPETVAVQSLSDATINLIDCTVTVRNDLALAFGDIDSPDTVDLIRACATCGDLFWAGRADRWTCSRHLMQWRQKEYRRKKKQSQAETKRERTEAQKRKTIASLSRTAVALITAIMVGGYRVYWEIDNQACYYLRQIPVKKVPSNRIVRRTLTMLVKQGYLTYSPNVDPTEDRYEPDDELTDFWREIQRNRKDANPTKG